MLKFSLQKHAGIRSYESRKIKKLVKIMCPVFAGPVMGNDVDPSL